MSQAPKQPLQKHSRSSLWGRYLSVVCVLGLLTALAWLLIEQGKLPSNTLPAQSFSESEPQQAVPDGPAFVVTLPDPEEKPTPAEIVTESPASMPKEQLPTAMPHMDPPLEGESLESELPLDISKAVTQEDLPFELPVAKVSRTAKVDATDAASFQEQKRQITQQLSPESKAKTLLRSRIRKPSRRLESSIARRSAAYELATLPQDALDPHWRPLIIRLIVDGFDAPELVDVFSRLGPASYSPAYMGVKITELYGVGGMGINRDEIPEPELPVDYQAPIPDVTIASCNAFIEKYNAQFKDIRSRYGVPPHIIVGLLLIETRLGGDLGKDSALRALASMAATDTAAKLGTGKNSAQPKRVRPGALEATLKEKSDWAYKEVKALIRYGKENSTDLCKIPGSIYGAMGICQFMPSNIEPFGVDGDGDGRVDVFSVVDAMYSVASYLEANGWRGAKSKDRQHAVIRSYNHDDYYASQVLAVADRVEQGIKGKLSSSSSALAGIGPAAPRSLDPSLRRLRKPPPSTHIQSLGSYKDMVK